MAWHFVEAPLEYQHSSKSTRQMGMGKGESTGTFRNLDHSPWNAPGGRLHARILGAVAAHPVSSTALSATRTFLETSHRIFTSPFKARPAHSVSRPSPGRNAVVSLRDSAPRLLARVRLQVLPGPQRRQSRRSPGRLLIEAL